MTAAARVVRVEVPATSANLGPGFDSLGLALRWYDEVDVALESTGLAVHVTGEGTADVPRDETHLVVRALRATIDHLGGAQPGLDVRCRNTIPHGRGLGSSAAAAVAGVLAGRALVTGGPAMLSDAEAITLATAFEGHPDNVAPCVLGGVTVAWMEGDVPLAARLDPDPGLRPVLFIPTHRLATHAARGMLPAFVPHCDAATNAGRAALLVHALTTDPALLLPATQDRLHQDYRGAAMPETLTLVGLLRSAGVPAVVSGAGPAVLAFARPGEDLRGHVPAGWLARAVKIAPRGARVTWL